MDMRPVLSGGIQGRRRLAGRGEAIAMVVNPAVLFVAPPASTCKSRVALELGDIQCASVVIVGRTKNYEIVQSTDKRSNSWRSKSRSKRILSDYARFEVVVDAVLAGHPPQRIPVTWDNSTFGEHEAMKALPYLIALREPGSKTPPLRVPSETTLPTPESESLTVLQPCQTLSWQECLIYGLRRREEIIDL